MSDLHCDDQNNRTIKRTSVGSHSQCRGWGQGELGGGGGGSAG